MSTAEENSFASNRYDESEKSICTRQVTKKKEKEHYQWHMLNKEINEMEVDKITKNKTSCIVV